MKKIISLLLVLIICIWSVGAFAENGDNQNGEVIDEAVEDTSGDEILNEEEAAEFENEFEDETVDEEAGEDEAINEEVKEEKDKGDRSRESNRKTVQEELNAKKQERAEKRTDAKEYIKEIKKLFKDADLKTKKDILAEIAALKKELKDYSIGLFIRGLAVDFDKYDGVKPEIKENRTLVPIRAIVETLGAQVQWVEETQSIIITKDNTVIIMQIDNKKAYVNDNEVELDVAPTIVNKRTIVPLRFIAETFKLAVDWDEDSQTVIVD